MRFATQGFFNVTSLHNGMMHQQAAIRHTFAWLCSIVNTVNVSAGGGFYLGFPNGDFIGCFKATNKAPGVPAYVGWLRLETATQGLMQKRELHGNGSYMNESQISPPFEYSATLRPWYIQASTSKPVSANASAYRQDDTTKVYGKMSWTNVYFGVGDLATVTYLSCLSPIFDTDGKVLAVLAGDVVANFLEGVLNTGTNLITDGKSSYGPAYGELSYT